MFDYTLTRICECQHFRLPQKGSTDYSLERSRHISRGKAIWRRLLLWLNSRIVIAVPFWSIDLLTWDHLPSLLCARHQPDGTRYDRLWAFSELGLSWLKAGQHADSTECSQCGRPTNTAQGISRLGISSANIYWTRKRGETLFEVLMSRDFRQPTFLGTCRNGTD